MRLPVHHCSVEHRVLGGLTQVQIDDEDALAKHDNVANRRLAFARTRSKEIVGKLFTVLGPRYKERNGGYLRVLKAGNRPGDNAPMAYVELVDRAIAGAAVDAE